ncbi:protein kinase [Nonomuraea sp. NPDC050310]|uniref:serine/threonine-protein kinase n=1 Tax=unclassified Nonomuraea TaxID=2593643 RepID=UPI0033DB5DA0
MRQLGAGHTGRVFLATYQETGAYVAIKYLNAALRRDPDFMARYAADTPHLVELDDENVVRFYEYVETPTRAAVVMELVDGVSLRTLLTEHGRTGPEAALVVLKGTLLALAAAHAKGVAHRDVKPENVLVQADGTSKLGDFGVVGYVEEPDVPQGTPAYLAPEAWRQGGGSMRADLYAAACLLFECVMGRVPYRGSTTEVRDKHLDAPVPLELVPDTLRDLLRRGLAKDPAGRYGSAIEFAAELEEDALAGYGPDWEKRGRRHLGELATMLALRFPLADPSVRADAGAAETAVLRRRQRTWVSMVPRMPPHLWIAGGAVTAMLVGLLITRGDLPEGPFLMPPPESPHQIGTHVPSASRSAALPPGQSSGPTRRTRVPTTSTPPARPSGTRQPTSDSGGVPTPTQARPTPTPTASRTPPAGRPAVRSASITRWSGTTGSVRVSATNGGPVRLKVSFTRREGELAAQIVATQTHTLTGETAYTRTISHNLGEVPCGRRAWFGMTVATEPVSANGPQVSEIAVDGPACATPHLSPPPPTAGAKPTSTQQEAAGSPDLEAVRPTPSTDADAAPDVSIPPED